MVGEIGKALVHEDSRPHAPGLLNNTCNSLSLGGIGFILASSLSGSSDS